MIQETPSFWPQTAEGILVLIGKVAGFGAAVGVTIWRVYATRIKDLKQISDAHATEVEARKLLSNELRDEMRLREALRVEMKRDLADETDERKNRQEQQEKRILDLAQSLHIVMGDVTNLTEKVNKSQLSHVEEMGKLRLEIERGFNSLRQQIQEGFAMAFSWLEKPNGK